ncbi:MAG: crotonase/enoyl-CoA hydratase family protein [Halioglobus sp.]|nr:crotonase/enoyl-CoA hydratase family protein [Halioglobus sp.]
MHNEILFEIVDEVLIATINRPKTKNAINGAVAERLSELREELDRRDDLRVAIITGADGTFCSGMDLKAFLNGEMEVLQKRGIVSILEKPPRKPLIAAVEGFALAGGFELMITCDLVVAAENVVLGIPEVKRGLVAAGGGLLNLPRQIHKRHAKELALTGDNVSAQRAYEMGLVNMIVPAGETLGAAREMAAKICSNGPLAVAASKQIIDESYEWVAEEKWRQQAQVASSVFASDDAREGALAFTEKRPPRWSAT